MMTCLISVRETAVEDGNLYHKDIPKIWHKYDPSLYEWILNLTEEFDLTFPLKNGHLSLVPCLLSDQPPKFEWPDISESNSLRKKELKVLYLFSYLPAGLFNRLQVRLYQYADGSTIWKNGSLLKKNEHIALIVQDKNQVIEIKVQGSKPENIIYVIHEVLEVLINESFNGIEYDCSFPCLDCVDAHVLDPHMFKVSLIKRAIVLKAPFLQCSKSFHLISIPELQTLIPVDKDSNLDFQLESSIRDLNHLKRQLKYDVSIWYCGLDVPKTEADKAEFVDPLVLISFLKNSNYKIWYSNNPEEETFEKISYALKDSRTVLLCLSDSFAKDEKCMQVYELAKNIIRKNCIIIELGSTHNWLENPLFASICADYRCILRELSRFKHKIAELCEVLDNQLGFDRSLEIEEKKDIAPDVFISYCWMNSHDAVSKGTKKSSTGLGWLDPRNLKKTFGSHGMNVWLDISDSSNSSNLFNEITKGLNKASVFVACLSDEYVNSKNCVLEFRFAHCSLKKPIVKALVGTGSNWRNHEISFLGGVYPEINCQFENTGLFYYKLYTRYYF
jgi:leucine-rich repeat kinase 2